MKQGRGIVGFDTLLLQAVEKELVGEGGLGANRYLRQSFVQALPL